MLYKNNKIKGESLLVTGTDIEHCDVLLGEKDIKHFDDRYHFVT